LNSPFYLNDLIFNKFPKPLYDELINKDIYLIPKINDLTFKGYEKNKFTIETMTMFYSFGLLIEKEPSLLFKIHGFDLDSIFEEYLDVNYKVKQMVPKIIQKTDREKKKEINEENLEGLFKEVLISINFNKIPQSRKVLELLLKNKNNIIKKEIKSILKRLTYFKNQMLISNADGFDLEKFVASLNGDFDYKRLKKDNNSFTNNQFKVKNPEKVRIAIDKNYNLKSVIGFSHDYKTNFLFFEFFENVPWWTLEKYSYQIQFIYIIYQFSLKLLENISIIPELLEKNEKYLIRWIPCLFIDEVNNIFKKLSECCPKNLVLFDNKSISQKEQIKILVSLFIWNMMEKTNFEEIRLLYTPELKLDIYELFFSLKLTKISKEEMNQTNIWISNLFSFEKEHLLTFLISDKSEPCFNISLEIDSKNKKLKRNENSFKEKIQKLDKISKFKLFNEIYILEKYFSQIKDLITSVDGINLNRTEFADFYQNTMPILDILNFKVDLPKNLMYVTRPKIVSNLKLKSSNINSKNLLTLENLVDFDWKIAIGDKEISIDEFKKLVKISSKFIKIDDESYIVEEKDIYEISKKINKVPKKFKNNQLLQAVLSSSYDNTDVNIDKNILKVLDEIKNYKNIVIPKDLNGNLRGYQYRGFSWLVQNINIGFGSILADDMGLGKTLEILTTILHFKNEGYLKDGKALVIAPTAILFNWEKEIKHFTPSLTFDIFHAENRSINSDVDIIITSYGMIRNHFESFEAKKWFMVVADEAQNIKNPNTKQSKAIKKLKSKNKIALTGTPVENSLIDYWSIFDFTNKSYLESVKTFKQNYLNPIEKNGDNDILEKFKIITSPFILRRLKTDKNIINDLPDKIITECYCPLTKTQAALYEDTIDKTLNKIEKSAGIERKGMVFKLINSLKQICNHPSQFKKKNKFDIKESGKMEMLIDIIDNINENKENKEKIIIFTQFVQMGNIIVELLKDKFKADVMFYHGSLTRKKRDKIIDEFQNNIDKQILIVSLKAGGTGLNLTAANHVVHFDLWWNPAVENQATDRVFRIGQKKNVFVYRFITNGTFEEKINEMLMNKKELAEITIGTGEKFITEMSNEELQELISLM